MLLYTKNNQNKNINITLFNNEKYTLKPNEEISLGEYSDKEKDKLFKLLKKEIKVYEKIKK